MDREYILLIDVDVDLSILWAQNPTKYHHFLNELAGNWGTPVVVIFGRDHILQVCLGHVRSYLLAFSDQSES